MTMSAVLTPVLIAAVVKLVEKGLEVFGDLLSDQPDLQPSDIARVVDEMFAENKRQELREWAIVQLGKPGGGD
jgi:hypothetical protein